MARGEVSEEETGHVNVQVVLGRCPHFLAAPVTDDLHPKLARPQAVFDDQDSGPGNMADDSEVPEPGDRQIGRARQQLSRGAEEPR